MPLTISGLNLSKIKHRFIALFVLIFFFFDVFFSFPAFAVVSLVKNSSLNSENPILFFPGDQHLTLSPELGTVEDRFKGRGPYSVILIQDAHAIGDVQKSILKLVKHFTHQYGVDLIAMEGASGKLDPTLFNVFPDRELLKETFAHYLDRGELSGAAAASVLDEKQADYHGIENQMFYEKTITEFLEAVGNQSLILPRLEKQKLSLNRLKKKYYSPEWLRLDQQIEAFEDNRIEMLQFLKFLKPFSSTKQYPHLAALFLEIEKDRPQETWSFSEEIKRLTKSLKHQRLTNEQTRQFHRLVQDYQTERISAEKFVQALLPLINDRNMTFRASELLKNRIKQHLFLEKAKGPEVFKELQAYLKMLKGHLIRTRKERVLDQRNRTLRLLHKLARLELTREEWGEIKINEAGLWSNHLAFYRLAEKRDQIFTQNLLNLMNQKKQPVSLFVAGGFHTQGLIHLFKQKGISFLLISPRIESVPNQTCYLEYMRGQVSWRDYFKVRNGRINLYEAFSQFTAEQLIRLNPSLANSWREALLRKLALENRIDQSKQYTQFIDRALFKRLDTKDQESMKKAWFQKVDRFISNLRQLKNEKQLTSENVMRIAASHTAQVWTAIPFVKARYSAGWLKRKKSLTASRTEVRRQPQPSLPLKLRLTGPFLKLIYYLFIRPFIRIRITGLEKLPPNPFLVVSSHISLLDGLVLTFEIYLRTGRFVLFLAKPRFLGRFQRFLIWLGAAIPVDPRKEGMNEEEKHTRVTKIVSTLHQRIYEGWSVGTFPSGEAKVFAHQVFDGPRDKTRMRTRWRNTMARAAIEINRGLPTEEDHVQVVPIALSGRMLYGGKRKWGRLARSLFTLLVSLGFRKPFELEVAIGAPIHPKGKSPNRIMAETILAIGRELDGKMINRNAFQINTALDAAAEFDEEVVANYPSQKNFSAVRSELRNSLRISQRQKKKLLTAISGPVSLWQEEGHFIEPVWWIERKIKDTVWSDPWLLSLRRQFLDPGSMEFKFPVRKIAVWLRQTIARNEYTYERLKMKVEQVFANANTDYTESNPFHFISRPIAETIHREIVPILIRNRDETLLDRISQSFTVGRRNDTPSWNGHGVKNHSKSVAANGVIQNGFKRRSEVREGIVSNELLNLIEEHEKESSKMRPFLYKRLLEMRSQWQEGMDETEIAELTDRLEETLTDIFGPRFSHYGDTWNFSQVERILTLQTASRIFKFKITREGLPSDYVADWGGEFSEEARKGYDLFLSPPVPIEKFQTSFAVDSAKMDTEEKGDLLTHVPLVSFHHSPPAQFVKAIIPFVSEETEKIQMALEVLLHPDVQGSHQVYALVQKGSREVLEKTIPFKHRSRIYAVWEAQRSEFENIKTSHLHVRFGALSNVKDNAKDLESLAHLIHLSENGQNGLGLSAALEQEHYNLKWIQHEENDWKTKVISEYREKLQNDHRPEWLETIEIPLFRAEVRMDTDKDFGDFYDQTVEEIQVLAGNIETLSHKMDSTKSIRPEWNEIIQTFPGRFNQLKQRVEVMGEFAESSRQKKAIDKLKRDLEAKDPDSISEMLKRFNELRLKYENPSGPSSRAEMRNDKAASYSPESVKPLRNLTIAMSVMEAGADIVRDPDGRKRIVYRRNLERAAGLLPLLRHKLGTGEVYLYGGLFRPPTTPSIAEQLHQVPDRGEHFLQSHDKKVIVMTQNYHTKEEWAGDMILRDDQGNPFSITSMLDLNPNLSNTREAAGTLEKTKWQFKEFTNKAHQLGMKVAVDFIPWLAPDAINAANLHWTFHRRLELWKNEEFRRLNEQDKFEFIKDLLRKENGYFFAVRIGQGSHEEVVLVRHLQSMGSPNVDESILNPLELEVMEYYLKTLRNLIDLGVDKVRVDLGGNLLLWNLGPYVSDFGKYPDAARELERREEPWQRILRETLAYAKSKGTSFEFIMEAYHPDEQNYLAELSTGVRVYFKDIFAKLFEMKN